MGTRSRIGVENPDGSITSIYCHWDGYPDHNGAILAEHYTDIAKISELMDLGDLSSLGAEIGTKHDFNEKVRNCCNAYGRDRGEKSVGSMTVNTIEKFVADGEEYNYLFRDSKWHVEEGNGSFRLLDDVLAELEEE